MKKIAVALACGAFTAGAMTTVSTPAQAQGTAAGPASFPDIPQNHWAYQAVADLAAKGYVKGYPDGDYLGQRALTRYEFATVLARMLATVNDLSAKVAAIPQTPPVTPTGTPVTQDDLNKIQALVDSFKTELDAIKADTAKFQDQIDALRQDILDTKDLVAKAQATANSSYGFGANRKFRITGYIQARYQVAPSGDASMFPQGAGAVTGATGSFNGNYAVGGTNATFVARRSRLKITGQLTPNTVYAIQIDAGGFTTNTSTPNNVSVREGNIAYTFGNGNANFYPTLTVGLFANYFGYELPLTAADILTPERPLAFNEGGSGIFVNQDYDRGAQLSYLLGGSGLKLTGGVVNGTGLNGNNNNTVLHQIYRVAYTPVSSSAALKGLGLGASYYDGRVAAPLAAITSPPTPGNPSRSAKKQLYGLDAHYNSPAGLFVLAEYIDGKYEQRSYFTSNTKLVTNSYAPGNKIQGYYVQGGWTFASASARPFTLGVSYDVFDRSKSGVGSSAPDGAGASGSSFDDENLSYGALYNLDKQTRLRLWYDTPNKVAHAANVAEPKKVGLFTAEVQVKF